MPSVTILVVEYVLRVQKNTDRHMVRTALE